MGCEERDEGRLGVETEGVVVQIDGMQVRQVEDGGEKGGEGLGNLVEQTAGEDIGEVRDLLAN